MEIVGFVVLSYLLGSIPSAVWIGKALYGVDVREYGSGNAGATNTFRVLGKKAGFIVLTMDVLKGFLAGCLVNLILSVEPGSLRFVNLQLLFGLSAVIGHLFPIFANFRGGKGIATLLGVVIAIHYLSALACSGIFIFMLFSTRYVSLSSITAAIMFPVAGLFIFKYDEPLFLAFAFCVALLVVLTHRKNIQRLFDGSEGKAKILKRHYVEDGSKSGSFFRRRN